MTQPHTCLAVKAPSVDAIITVKSKKDGALNECSVPCQAVLEKGQEFV